MKTILFITNEYPAKASATSLAAELVINKIKNYNVKILSINGVENKEKGIYCIKYNGKKKMHNIINRIKLVLLGIIYPISRPLLIYKLIKEAKRIINDTEIDAVISVCFPIETLVVGNYIKRISNRIKYIPYFIDGYACGILPKYLPKSFSKKRKIKFEKKVTCNADAVVRMNASRNFYDNSNWKENRFYLNPAFLNKPQKINNKIENNIIEKNMINIVYAGYIFLPDRDPSYLIDTLSKQKKYCLIFIGKNEAKNLIEKKMKNFKGKIKIIDHMDNERLRLILEQADIFVNLGVKNSNAISGKIFDYLAYGKPIISTYFKEDDATLEYLKKYELSLCINQKEESIKNAEKKVCNFIDNNLNKRIPFNIIEKKYYDSTPNAFIEVLNKII